MLCNALRGFLTIDLTRKAFQLFYCFSFEFIRRMNVDIQCNLNSGMSQHFA